MSSSGSEQDTPESHQVHANTTGTELLRAYPGRAAGLVSELRLPCVYCGGAPREPLAPQAATRHGRSPLAVVEACRALAREEGPDPEQIERARAPKAWRLQPRTVPGRHAPRPGCRRWVHHGMGVAITEALGPQTVET